MDVAKLSGADEVLERAGPYLGVEEARHNLAFGILSTARAHPDVYPELRAWVTLERGRVVGAALRTPPHNLILARPTVERALAALAHEIDDEPPGVVGAVPEVDAFVDAWTSRHGNAANVVFQQRIYAVTTVTPALRVAGALRLATAGDRDLVISWIRAFGAEVLRGRGDDDRIERGVDARLASDDAGVALWELDGRPVSLAGFGGPTPNGIRIGPVYTPPELRGRGFGTAVTAAISQRLLEDGRRFCFLYTDLANPTSNKIYVDLGYRRVCDSVELDFF